LAALGGCSLAPDYRPPVTAVPATFKEAPQGWTNASPADGAARGPWWTVFADPVLDDLEARVPRSSPTLAAAVARLDAARAAARGAAADLYPTLSAQASAARERLSGRRPVSTGSAVEYTEVQIGAALDYEVDLWGRVRNSVRAERAESDASAADLEAVRLSLHASVADAYFRLRGLDAEARLLDQTVAAFTRARDLTDTRHDGGIASGLDVSRAQTILSNARAQVSDIANRRAATEHEIAALVGEVASSFAISAAVLPLTPPATPVLMPAQLIERRPDVAQAERLIAANNARIGVARAAFFPDVTLGASGGFQAARGALLSSPATFWALGPLSALLSVFDGGRRQAQVRISRAQFEEAAANYRETVLGAFREVEDALAAQRTLATQAADQRASAEAADRTRELALVRYRDGASDYLDVVTAQTASLDAERATILVQTARMRAAVALIRASGGDYRGAAS
jgi:multidrug efflux system outer membrane protein